MRLIFSFLILSILGCSKPSTYVPKPVKKVKPTVEEVTQSFVTKKIRIQAPDGVTIFGNLYHNNNKKEVILLCHQARFNKFEYDEIAPRLRDLGYNVLAIDQRSGGTMGDMYNETSSDAISKYKRKKVIPDSLILEDYVKAEVDIIAATNYLNQIYKKPIILWGSSYSSTLALYQALYNEKIKASISFSPGNYMAAYKGDLKEALTSLNKPMFVTSSKNEAQELKELISGMTLSENQVQFVPSGKGQHGSKALWTKNEGHEEYWQAIELFLNHLVK